MVMSLFPQGNDLTFHNVEWDSVTVDWTLSITQYSGAGWGPVDKIGNFIPGLHDASCQINVWKGPDVGILLQNDKLRSLRNSTILLCDSCSLLLDRSSKETTSSLIPWFPTQACDARTEVVNKKFSVNVDKSFHLPLYLSPLLWRMSSSVTASPPQVMESLHWIS